MNEVRIGVGRKTRAITIAGVAALHVALVAALIAAFGVEAVVETVRSVAAFNVPAPPASPSPTPEPAPRVERSQGAAARPAPKATPWPRPTAKIVLAPTPAPVTATGDANRSGASVTGAGSGASGQGAGTGSGGHGNGPGGGAVRRAEKISGELRTKDFPRSGADERDGRFIIVRYVVGTDGRVGNCRVVQSSGSAEADTITCRLIEKRFRYRPAQTADGTPIADETGWKQWWWRPD
ncbi:TonB family protein [Novosphingobium sp. Gsoil 351]|uniref:TonB family protein n=1 Tax=Novosphingobium sp. Gsoil 351 TaxID=2675225 RepID=UPI0012B45AA4|nr:TonB family protein [Novosphingobium sp. Gsoil 351]QGN55266.1 TonB family protein [Novosphingobium sp. Gsoil 351]